MFFLLPLCPFFTILFPSFHFCFPTFSIFSLFFPSFFPLYPHPHYCPPPSFHSCTLLYHKGELEGSITNKMFFFSRIISRIPDFNIDFFFVKGQNLLCYRCFSTQNVLLRKRSHFVIFRKWTVIYTKWIVIYTGPFFIQVDCSLYEVDRILYKVYILFYNQHQLKGGGEFNHKGTGTSSMVILLFQGNCLVAFLLVPCLAVPMNENF